MKFVRPAFACLLLLLAASPTLAGEWFDLSAPARVGVGKPFVVRIASRYPADDVAVEWRGRTVRVPLARRGESYEAAFLLGTDLRCDLGSYPLVLNVHLWATSYRFERTVEVVESAWDHETLNVPPKMVRPPKSAMARIKRERKLVRAALATATPERAWSLPFVRPVKGKMLSRFGLYRVFNGDVASRHTGLDFRAWAGTPIHAMAAGTVVLTGSFYYAGNAVWIDHGQGLVSMSCHLSKRLVKAGDRVAAGQPIGLSGATGRVTGAHLHLGVFLLGEAVDPALFFDGTIANEFNESHIISVESN
ncbi:M23 family metallopeptidase [Pseudodesulfovibrio sp.]|uniref:M23 family metallopeptidase n=1 Tax=Pseudodesulfovibrio sp. TaxID=2035812 RepID=UPI0026174A36|nr:M23 family metallopeptidase [Pseudodesulfovibrio sp.]MDD3313585.1 M23 family metallopeptidase [Pseudodesulfovibrio sp.]